MPNIDIQQANDRLAAIAKKLAETKEPRKFDFSSTPIALTLGQNEGTTLANLAKPANFNLVPVGSEAKIAVNIPTNPADLPPTDDVQMAMIGTYLWINKAQGNVMNWGEVKTQLQAGKIMVVERLADVVVGGNSYRVFQLARWEDAPSVGGSSGRWETIDQTKHVFNDNTKVRITGNALAVNYVIVGYLQKANDHYSILKTYDIAIADPANTVIFQVFWRTNMTADRTKAASVANIAGQYTITENGATISKFEIWKED